MIKHQFIINNLKRYKNSPVYTVIDPMTGGEFFWASHLGTETPDWIDISYYVPTDWKKTGKCPTKDLAVVAVMKAAEELLVKYEKLAYKIGQAELKTIRKECEKACKAVQRDLDRLSTVTT